MLKVAPAARVYTGSLNPDPVVRVVEVAPSGLETTPKKLNMRLDLAGHSPDGPSWGYGGSGPAQLSLALLADALQDDKRALSLYQDFKWELIARLPKNEGWTLSDAVVRTIATRIEQLRKAACKDDGHAA